MSRSKTINAIANFAVPITISKLGEYYITARESFNREEAVVLRLPRSTYFESFEAYANRLADYHESITNFAGAGYICYENVEDTNCTILLNDSYDEVTDTMLHKEYKVFTYAKASSFYADVEHG